ncbi:hypothetical protein C8A05DRAFT_29135 [Staphylotrichum tortipilum]|uniref:Uncharacterized protein n=1 Tax=Staphylotrichum tortipilum TaxID=2831512 RepID=A0AAN6RYB7_9PEZI|nr:hypothetical protein C8A05DRAFT_29135 [Staphylotrichum longicolle]
METLPGHAWYEEVKVAAENALKLLKTPKSRKALADIGKDAVRAWDRHEHVYFDKLDQMSEWVDVFLDRLGKNFVTVELAKRIPYSGAFEPNSWNEEGARAKVWEPRLAGKLYINCFAYDRFSFLVTVTIAHELVHCFMGFLSGAEQTDSPISLAGFTYEALGGWGDSGTAWERRVLGGVASNLEEPAHPLGRRQAGTQWLIDPFGSTHEIDFKHAFKRESCPDSGSQAPPKGNVVFVVPLPTTGQIYARDEKYRKFKDMSRVRQARMEQKRIPVELERSSRLVGPYPAPWDPDRLHRPGWTCCGDKAEAVVFWYEPPLEEDNGRP